MEPRTNTQEERGIIPTQKTPHKKPQMQQNHKQLLNHHELFQDDQQDSGENHRGIKHTA